jgi:MOSC domain-containing protein YiiM
VVEIMAGESGSIVSVQIGRIAPLGRRRVPSGFLKQPVSGPVMAGELGLAGDQQADLRVHGGPDKAVYCYPSEHYEKWRKLAPSSTLLLVPGGFGENLTTQGLEEDHVCIGDVFRAGGAVVQVTQPRQPCFKLALRFDDKQMVRAMVRSGLSGWYLRVLAPGPVEAGAPIRLIERPNPQWSIARFNGLTGRGGTPAEIAELANLPGLARDVQSGARAALAKL